MSEAIRKIGIAISTQDNRATDAPIFIVQQRKRIYGMDPSYSDNYIWFDGESVADEETHQEMDEKHDRGDDTGEWVKTAFIDTWDFVTACFTEQGCKDYLAANGHNLTDPRIYAASSYRNAEFRAVRDFLKELKYDN